MEVEILKYPTQEDWKWVKTCTLNTVGKTSVKDPTTDWKIKLLKAEHSPIRELWFGIRMKVPYYVMGHFVRHHIGCNHYVQTQRDDRTNNPIPRAELPQGAEVSYILSINAQELMFLARKRLCMQAAEETRQVVKEIVRQVEELCPEFKGLFGPLCQYRNGACDEFYCCGLNKKFEKK